MLSVLLLILKILLWIILGLLGLVLVLLLLVLFAPITYCADVRLDEDISINAKIRYLVVSVLIKFNKNDKNLDTVIKIFGIPLKKKEKKPKKEKKKSNVLESKEEADVKATSFDEKTEDKQPEAIADTTADTSQADADEYDLWDAEDDILELEEKKLSGRAKKLAKGIADKAEKVKPEKIKPEKIISDIDEKKSKIEKKLKRFKKFWDMKCTVRTRKYLKKYLVGLFKHIAPRKVKGRLRYGFGDPAKTGEITGYISLLPFVYQKGFSLEPDFYEKIIEGHVYLKGRIILGYIARIILKKYIWQTIKMAKKI